MTGRPTRTLHPKIRLTLYLQCSSGPLNFGYVERNPLPLQTLLHLPRVTLLPYKSDRPFRSSATHGHPDTLPQSSPIPLTWTLPPTPSTSPARPGVPGPPVISRATAMGAPGKIWAPSLANATISTPPFREGGSRACPSRVAAGVRRPRLDPQACGKRYGGM